MSIDPLRIVPWSVAAADGYACVICGAAATGISVKPDGPGRLTTAAFCDKHLVRTLADYTLAKIGPAQETAEQQRAGLSVETRINGIYRRLEELRQHLEWIRAKLGREETGPAPGPLPAAVQSGIAESMALATPGAAPGPEFWGRLLQRHEHAFVIELDVRTVPTGIADGPTWYRRQVLLLGCVCGVARRVEHPA